MVILLVGIIAFILGLAMARNKEMDDLLQRDDNETWRTVMSPSNSGYVNSFGIIQLFSWILSHGYENSISPQVQTLGGKALRRAKIAKYVMILGVLLIVVGFYVALLLQK